MRNRILQIILIRFLITLLGFDSQVFSQNLCGTQSPSAKQFDKVKNNILSIKKARLSTNDIKWVPIKINILRKANGSFDEGKEVTLLDVNNAIAYTNSKFISSGVQFFIYGNTNSEADYQIKSDVFYNTIYSSGSDTEAETNSLCSGRDNIKTLNMYIVANIKNNIGGYALYPTSDDVVNTRIFINATGVSTLKDFLNYTICHELGHSFFLMHTFETAHAIYRGGVNGRELVNRLPVNCENKGDLFCDTEADPYDPTIETPVGGVNVVKSNGSLSYTGDLKDTENALYTPPLNNPMSYYYWQFKSERTNFFNFTSGQINLITNFYETRRGWSNNNISAAPLLNPANAKPTGLQTTIISTLNKITWSNVTGNSGYIIERSTSANSGFVAVGGVGPNSTSFTDNTSSLRTDYYYRVRCSNSTSYSDPVFSGLCTPQFQTVSLYANSAGTIKLNKWDEKYVNKVIKHGLMDKSRIVSLSGATKPTLGEVAEAVILTAKKLWPSRYSNLVKVCYDENKYAAYLNEIKNLQVNGIASNATPNQNAELSQVAEMVWKVILNGSGESTVALNLPASYKGINSDFTGTGIAKELANVKVPIFKKNSREVTFNSKEFLLGKKNVITRDILAKIIANAYEIKNNAIGGVYNGRVNVELASNEYIDDVSTLGYKDEFEVDVPDGTPTLQVTGASEVIQSGAQWWIEMTPTGFGNNVQFYWTVEGALQGARLDPFPGSANYQKIYFTAPTVTTETFVNMVIYAASEDGKAVEMYKEFKVVPIPNNGCITLLTPNISFDRVAGSSSSTKACNLNNGSTSNTATLNTTITGPNAINFYVTPTNTTLSSGSQMSFDVSCNASTVGTYTASLEITQTGLSGCPTKITVPLLANVTAATSEPGLTWAEPLTEGSVFYSGSNIPSGSNTLRVNNIYSGTEFRYQASGGNLTTINACSINPQITANFPEGMFSKNVRFWARKKDCGTNTSTGNWVLTPPMTVIPTPNPNINVVYPNGEEILTSNQMYEIKWSGNSTSSVTLVFSTDGGVTFPHTIATNLTASAGKYNWVVPILSPTLNLSPNNFNTIRIKIISGSFSDVSDGNFAIKPPMYLNPTVQQACDDKGQILITASGGKGTLSYLVTPGNYTTTDIRGLNAGTYTVKVTDATGESIQTTVTVPTYIPRNFTYDKVDATCGGKNGSIKITGFSSGFFPKLILLYKIVDEQRPSMTFINNENSNLEFGSYQLYVSDGICSITKNIEINPDINFSVATVLTNASCGQSNGAITLTTSSAATFLWANGATTSGISNLQQGTQFVRITNSNNGCQINATFQINNRDWAVSNPYTIANIKNTAIRTDNGKYYFIGVDNKIKVYNSSLVLNKSIDLPTYGGYEPASSLDYLLSNDELYPTNRGVVALAKNSATLCLYKINTSTDEIIDFNPGYYSNTLLLNLNDCLLGNYIYLSSFFGAVHSYSNNLGFYTQNGVNEASKKIAITPFYLYSLNGIGEIWKLDLNTLQANITQNTDFFKFNPVYSAVNIVGSRWGELFVISQNSSNGFIEKYPFQSTTSSQIFNLTGKPSTSVKPVFDFLLNNLFIPLQNGTVDILSLSTNKVVNYALNGELIKALTYDEVNKRCVVITENKVFFIQKDQSPKVINVVQKDFSCNTLGSIELTISGGGTPTYSWSNGATTKDISNLTANTYTVTVTPSDGGCAVRKSIKVENVGVVPTATLSNPANKTNFCVGESVQLVANQGTGLTYQWQKDGIDVSGATQQTFYATTTGSYRVKVKNTTGCEAISSAISLTANSLPTAVITPLSSTTICEGSKVTLQANAATNQSYIWLKDDAVIQGQTSQNFVANSAGSYQVVTILNGCSNISSITNITINPPPSAPTVLSSTINSGQTATLTASGCAGTVTWYANATGSTGLTIGASYTTPTLTTTTTYYASCTVSGCESTARGSGIVTVNIDSNPCPSTISHSGNIIANTYTASQTVISTANAPTLTTYIAGKSIQLNPGFQAGSNELFRAEIGGCMPTTGLIAYYPFNGNANDAVGTSHGTVNGAILTNDRKGNSLSAYSFNGTNSYIEVPHSSIFSLTGPITLSVWLNSNIVSSQRIIDKATVNYSDAWMTDLRPDGTIRFIVATSSSQSNMVFNNNNVWYHFVCTYDNSIVKFYKNGVLINTVSRTGLSTTNTNPLRFGANSLLNGDWFNGKMDDIRIYNRALTDQEVKNIYNIER